MLPSKILLTLVDYAIFPAILSAGVKIASSLLFLYFLKIPFSFVKIGGLPIVVPEITTDFIKINALSDLALLTILSLVIVFLLVRAHFFHSTHLSPEMTIKTLDLNLARLIGNSFDLFSQGVVWLSFLWLTAFSLVLSFLWQSLNFAVLATSFTLCIFLTFVFILDVEREIK